ncbi:MAG: sdhD [Rickettsiaceae bacterium]|jgi:succinate dehydrogenase / fumarate reductase membrane anchor subunit|nr:sdhD [Rickettsiaceae bacterium]
MNKNFLHSGLKKARNLGAAGHGVSHWWFQRFTAILLIPLTAWLVCFGLKIKDASMQEIHDYLRQPLHFTSLILFLTSAFYHASIGMQVIIEDYVSCIKARFALIILLKVFALVTVAAAIIAQCFFVFS